MEYADEAERDEASLAFQLSLSERYFPDFQLIKLSQSVQSIQPSEWVESVESIQSEQSVSSASSGRFLSICFFVLSPLDPVGEGQCSNVWFSFPQSVVDGDIDFDA